MLHFILEFAQIGASAAAKKEVIHLATLLLPLRRPRSCLFLSVNGVLFCCCCKRCFKMRGRRRRGNIWGRQIKCLADGGISAAALAPFCSSETMSAVFAFRDGEMHSLWHFHCVFQIVSEIQVFGVKNVSII
jgi:hypothetical protein